ncbi:amino acid ABC transporter permease [Helicobacter sp. 11S02629-2]|uniref:amino acid ABC transporter permease n=1 Tax=Helicobacter sp. 11S02629-2 TaxID=1476195 RepID=UPI000BA6631D|nr:amino acid ABC transporter permease [Helicobacter sp. 11S02629-2]PAF44620.1 hypothetical protein BKH40_05155 [Helicobacter sp. 11S02629-2]
MFHYILEVFVSLIKGLPYTLLIMIVGFVIGSIIGFILSLLRIYKVFFFSWLAGVYVSFFRGTPLLVQILLAYQGLPLVLKDTSIYPYIRDLGAIYYVLFVYVLYSSAYLSEIFRSALLSVPHSQMEASYSVGMSTSKALFHVIIPQALSNAMPNLSNFIILLIKDTSLASIATIPEVMGLVNQEIANTRSVFTVFLVAAVIYWVISVVLEKIFGKLEKRHSLHKRKI